MPPIKRNNPGCSCCECIQEVATPDMVDATPWDVTGDWEIADGVAAGSTGHLLWKNSWASNTRAASIAVTWITYDTRLVGGNVIQANQFNTLTLVADWADDQNYHKATFDMPANTLSIYSVVAGVETLLKTVQTFVPWVNRGFPGLSDLNPGEIPSSCQLTITFSVDRENGLVIARAFADDQTIYMYTGLREIAVARGNVVGGTRVGVLTTEDAMFSSAVITTCADAYQPHNDCQLCDPEKETLVTDDATVVLSGFSGEFAMFNGTYAVPFTPRNSVTTENIQCVSTVWICGWWLSQFDVNGNHITIIVFATTPLVAVVGVYKPVLSGGGSGGGARKFVNAAAVSDCNVISTGNMSQEGCGGGDVGVLTMSVTV